MTFHIELCRCRDEVDVAEQTTTRVPARCTLVLRLSLHQNLVCLTIFQLLGDVDVKSHVTIVRTANALTVQVDVGSQHNTFKIQQHSLVLQVCRRCDGLLIPARTNFLEASCRQTALDVCCCIRVVGFLVSRWRHPRLRYLEIVGYVDVFGLFKWCVTTEYPVEIQRFHRTLCHSAWGY